MPSFNRPKNMGSQVPNLGCRLEMVSYRGSPPLSFKSASMYLVLSNLKCCKVLKNLKNLRNRYSNVSECP